MELEALPDPHKASRQDLEKSAQIDAKGSFFAALVRAIKDRLALRVSDGLRQACEHLACREIPLAEEYLHSHRALCRWVLSLGHDAGDQTLIIAKAAPGESVV
jgi:hypothetical protein